MPNRRAIALALACFVLAAPVLAQDEEASGEQAQPSGPPTVTGRTEAVGFVTRAGMTFELAGGARLVIPPNLPVGTSRRTVFAISRERPRNQDVAEGFRRYGDVLRFDGAIDATRAPVVVSVRARRSPARPNERLVLAMEQATMCSPQHSRPLPGGAAGLCSSWVLIDARHEGDRLIAEIPTPGGFRLVFGTVPAPEPAE
ncbi:MAG TPA: hypothetical protein VIL20_21135 [Sandaracinaceae bacterium]